MIGVGIDIVEVDRFRSASTSLINRLFTSDERAYAEQFADPAPSFAARFAAKEATMKALGVGLGAFGFHDVEVVRAKSGAPQLSVFNEAERLAGDYGITRFLLSLSHTSLMATAVVMAQ